MWINLNCMTQREKERQFGFSYIYANEKIGCWAVINHGIVNRGNGYETRQSSLLYVFVLFFGLDPAQNTIVVYSVLRN